jgi:hypothetical protein
LKLDLSIKRRTTAIAWEGAEKSLKIGVVAGDYMRLAQYRLRSHDIQFSSVMSLLLEKEWARSLPLILNV